MALMIQTQTHGTQITATREGASKTRDSQKGKNVVVVKKRDYGANRRERNSDTREKDYLEIGGSRQEEPGRGQTQAQVVEAGDPDLGGAGGTGQGSEGDVHQ